MKPVRPFVLPALALIAAVTGCAPGASRDPGARAIRIADQVMESLGGKSAWDHLVGLRWTFQAAVNDTLKPGRRHSWDKVTGWHRVELDRQGAHYVIIHKVGADSGMAWVDGKPIEGDSLKKLVKLGNRTWVNDTYWMLMPYKLRDPGVNMKWDGDTTMANATFDRLALAFDHVGDTPGDHYWVYVDRANHRVERWDMVLQDEQPPPVSYTWEGWEQHGGLWFPTAHKGEKATIYTKDVETVNAFPGKEFSAP